MGEFVDWSLEGLEPSAYGACGLFSTNSNAGGALLSPSRSGEKSPDCKKHVVGAQFFQGQGFNTFKRCERRSTEERTTLPLLLQWLQRKLWATWDLTTPPPLLTHAQERQDRLGYGRSKKTIFKLHHLSIPVGSASHTSTFIQP